MSAAGWFTYYFVCAILTMLCFVDQPWFSRLLVRVPVLTATWEHMVDGIRWLALLPYRLAKRA